MNRIQELRGELESKYVLKKDVIEVLECNIKVLNDIIKELK